MSISPARTAAFQILLRVEQEDAYASELLHSGPYAQLSPADHGLATGLVMGVLRWQSLLDSQISRFSDKRLEKLDTEVLAALRLAAYQLLYLDRIPGRAAVHESVELVKRARKASAAPFANAVLRKLAARAPVKEGGGGYDVANAVSWTFSGQADIGKQGETAEFASAAGLSQRFAHPLWLVERWTRHFGPERAWQVCLQDQFGSTTKVRFSEAGMDAELRRDGIELGLGELLTSARRVRSGRVSRTRAFAEGRVAIQDEASQLVALLVGKGSRILDCCAAPGGKTRVLAERNPNAEIVALELHAHRARLLRKLVPARNVEVINADALDFAAGADFDRVLADVPCSGTGTLAHNPEIKWRLKPEDLSDLQARQLAILRAAMHRVAPGGRLVYSTCSLEPEENEEVVEKALSGQTEFSVFDCRLELEHLQAEGELAWKDLDSLASGRFLRTFPGVHPCDGFFVAMLQKS
ncbi:MAG: 16S rRNA (cytosine(967)-C(5))-methyltransferase RsmB [Terriglobales bacterium]